jgi:TonB family protein
MTGKLDALLWSLFLAGPGCAYGTETIRNPAGDLQISKMHLPVGQCAGKYTEGARRAGLEGTVILDIVVAEDGTVRDVAIVQGLGEGLSEAAVRALKSCRFTPGERDGKPVPVRIRRFKVTFALGEAT